MISHSALLRFFPSHRILFGSLQEYCSSQNGGHSQHPADAHFFSLIEGNASHLWKEAEGSGDSGSIELVRVELELEHHLIRQQEQGQSEQQPSIAKLELEKGGADNRGAETRDSTDNGMDKEQCLHGYNW